MQAVMISTRNTDAGLVPAKRYGSEAQKLANETGETVTVRDPVSDSVIATILPQRPRVKKTTKANGKGKATTKAKAKPAKADKAPRGMVVKILKLASRPNGVSPAELNKLTTWKGAPWKWLFSNPKKNGYCDRWGYKLAILHPDKEDPRAVRYQVKAK